MLELLAPAGNFEKLEAAVTYGADAVYLGLGSYNLRAQSQNFDLDHGLPRAIDYCHLRGVKVYLTLNALLRDSKLAQLQSEIRKIAQLDLDAVIVADAGVIHLLRQEAPHLDIHISTQASVTNSAACKFWAEQGASRIILARELSLKEIKEIRQNLDPKIELECFVHGAMCVAYSGRCLMSAYYNNRQANLGECTQPCRWKFKGLEIREAKHEDRPLIMEEDEEGSYLMSSSDLCLIEHIPELVEAGISSFKIEGRTKSAYYVATVVSAYRQALDAYLKDPANYVYDPSYKEQLSKTIHRHFDTGFYFNDPKDKPSFKKARVHPDNTMFKEARVAGVVKAFLPDSKLILVEQRNKLSLGDEVEIISPKQEFTLKIEKILDLERREIESTPHAKMLYYLEFSWKIPPGSFIRLNLN